MRPTLALASLLVLVPLAGAQSPYQGTIANWVSQDALDPPPKRGVVLVGSSSVRLWERASYDLRAWNLVQRGFGGSQFSDLNQFVDELVLTHDPACVVVFEGTNDVAAGKSAGTVYQDYLTFVDLVHQGQDPRRAPIPIVYIGITPTPARWAQWPIASQVNVLVAAHAATEPALFYADVPSLFLATGGPPDPALFLSDGLHLNQSGYDLWTQAIRPVVLAASPPVALDTHNPSAPPAGASVFVDLGPGDWPSAAHTPSPDANGNAWANWFRVSSGTHLLAGEHLGALPDTSGANTGFGLVITGEFNTSGQGGLTAPSPGLLGPLAVATATQDYVSADEAWVPGGLMLRGLDPSRSYDLTLFASRSSSTPLVTRYVVRGAGVRTQELSVSSNPGVTASWAGLRPDAGGRLWIDLETVQGRAILSLLRLDVGPHVGRRHKVKLR